MKPWNDAVYPKDSERCYVYVTEIQELKATPQVIHQSYVLTPTEGPNPYSPSVASAGCESAQSVFSNLCS